MELIHVKSLECTQPKPNRFYKMNSLMLPVPKQKPPKGWLAIAKLKPLSLFISLLLMLKKALDNGKMVK